MDCDSPTTKKHIKEAKTQGCKLIAAGSTNTNRRYELPCGHEQVVDTGAMRAGEFGCKICLAEKLNFKL